MHLLEMVQSINQNLISEQQENITVYYSAY